MISLGEIALYEESGAGRGARRIVAEHWPRLRRAGLLRAQVIRGDACALHANALLSAAAAAPPAERRALLARAGRLARALLRERMPWITAKARLILAGICAQRGQPDAARQHLRAALPIFSSAGMALHLCAARRRLASLCAGDEAAELRALADAWLAAQDVKEPARLVAMVAPGRWEG
jgi:hypothetical protein